MPIETAGAVTVPTTEQYAASIVEKYHIAGDPGSAPHRAVDEVVPLLKQWAKQYLLGITLSGACAKNTAITLTSQADVVIALSPELQVALEPLLHTIEALSERIVEYNDRIGALAEQRYPQVELLKQIKGVGTLIALTFLLTLEDRIVFAKAATWVAIWDCSRGAGTQGSRTLLVQGALLWKR